jgi:16S rRNA (guanine966-N2)-methyltransferase
MRTGNNGVRQPVATRGAQSRTLRIIGGAWRGRRFRFPDIPDIRPTPDRVRETLFNWLGRDIQQSRCLDLFAGSGALGLEALSRGAVSVVFVEQVAAAARDLQQRLVEWKASNAVVIRSDALQYLRAERDPGDRFEIVFLDPPFAQDLLPAAARLLEERDWLAAKALIYIEAPAAEALLPLPANWRQMKAKQAGEVGYHLYARGERGGAAT